MRVPAPVRRVLDAFPLVTLPPWPVSLQQSGTYVHIYGLHNGLPADPQCLAFVALLLLTSEAKLIHSSPYISSHNKLPLVQFESGTAVTSMDELMCVLFPAITDEGEVPLYSNAELNAFKTLIQTWINEAWYSTMLKPQLATMRRQIYHSPSDEFIPWPFRSLVDLQLDDLLYGSTEKCASLSKASMALRTFEQMLQNENGLHIGPPIGDSGLYVLDILVFSYTWPITEIIPESDLAALVGPLLRSHARRVEAAIREKLYFSYR